MTNSESTTEARPITLRWRIHKGNLPLRRRHLRSLGPLELPEPLMGWIHERLEWAIANMFASDSDGVLVLSIDPAREVTVSLDDVRETPALGISDLLVEEGMIAGVQHEGEPLAGTVWLERDGTLFASCSKLVSATETLARDLISTLGLALNVQPQRACTLQSSAAFLISDEFGLVMIQERPEDKAPATAKLNECFSKLW